MGLTCIEVGKWTSKQGGDILSYCAGVALLINKIVVENKVYSIEILSLNFSILDGLCCRAVIELGIIQM